MQQHSSSPPSAFPPPLPASSRPPPFHPASHQSPGLSRGSTYYLTGSAAPSNVAHRRPSYAPAPNPPSRLPPPIQHMQQQATDSAVCQCCATTVRYPRGARSFRCMICGVVCDLKGPRGVAAAWNGSRNGPPPPPLPAPTCVTEEEVLSLAAQFGSAPSSSAEPSSKSTLSSAFSSLSLSSSKKRSSNPFAQTNNASTPEEQLIDSIHRAFSSLPSLEASFRRTPTRAPNSSAPPPLQLLPTFETLSTFYDSIKSRPKAMELLRDAVESLLERPGETVWDGNGGWVVSLVECPIWWSEYTPDQERRHRLVTRFIGLLSNLPNNLHHALVATYLCPSTSTASLYPKKALLSKVELIVSFVSARIGACMSQQGGEGYAGDWGVKAGAKVGALFFAANLSHPRLPLSAFYCTLVDSLGEAAMVDGFLRWEARDGRFTLCQYPFLLSLGVKIHLLTFDGQRQMREKAREAFHSTVYRRMLEAPFLHMTVRRSSLVQDSLQQISKNSANLKKGLKITFEGEDGIDAGGLRKEWFLLLCRQLFDPQWGMFIHDPDSNLCWFNPVSHDLDEFYLVGVVVGLACYNAATLDVPLPQAVYKKLLNEPVTLADLAVFRPALARGLRLLLEYEETEEGGSVEDVFCRTFVGEVEEWGEVREEELMPGGAGRVVTRENREEFVQLFTSFLLDTSISSQFSAFSAGFTEVTSGNSLSLFKGEELELLVRGSDEKLDVEQLQGVTVYQGWNEEDETVQLFWHVFNHLPPTSQRLLLSFITGSDRIPATGSSALTLKLTNAGPDTGRYPTSHTCFNEICLYRYRGEERMRSMLEGAMKESEGFGLK